MKKIRIRPYAPSHLSPGFTLIEILIAMTIFGLVVASMYNLYINMQRTTTTQETIVDAQQNLRVSIEALGRDILMAGFIIPSTSTAIAAGSNATTLITTTSSPLYIATRISNDELEVLDSTTTGTPHTFTVEGKTDFFAAGHLVRIVRPMDGSQPFNPPANELRVVSKTATTLTLDNFDPTEDIKYQAGDMIVRVPILAGTVSSASDPALITWRRNGSLLERNFGEGFQAVADEIDGLTFGYLLDDGTEVAAPTATQLENIMAVRVTVSATTRLVPGDPPKERQVSSVIRIRN